MVLKKKKAKNILILKNNLSAYYPEGNITDVTPSFILSLNIFITLLQNKNISKIKAVPYLPIRYLSRDLAAESTKEEDKKKALLERNNAIQTNPTNKFIRTFRRLAIQNDSLQIETYPYELDEFLTIKLNSRKKELFLARDHFGVKPLFYTIKNGTLISKDMGIDKILAECPHFREWIEQISRLGA